MRFKNTSAVPRRAGFKSSLPRGLRFSFFEPRRALAPTEVSDVLSQSVETDLTAPVKPVCLISSLPSESNFPITVNRFDVGDFIGKSLSDSEKMGLLKNHWTPPRDYKFPKETKGHDRYYSHKHLDEYEWLVFSVVSTGYFCKYCPVFAVENKLQNSFVKCPFTNIKKHKRP